MIIFHLISTPFISTTNSELRVYLAGNSLNQFLVLGVVLCDPEGAKTELAETKLVFDTGTDTVTVTTHGR